MITRRATSIPGARKSLIDTPRQVELRKGVFLCLSTALHSLMYNRSPAPSHQNLRFEMGQFQDVNTGEATLHTGRGPGIFRTTCTRSKISGSVRVHRIHTGLDKYPAAFDGPVSPSVALGRRCCLQAAHLESHSRFVRELANLQVTGFGGTSTTPRGSHLFKSKRRSMRWYRDKHFQRHGLL